MEPHPASPVAEPVTRFARPTIGAIERAIMARAVPSPISPLLAHDAVGYARLDELTSILSTGAMLRVSPPTIPPTGGPPGLPTRRAVNNHGSVKLYATQVRAQLEEEVAAGTTYVLGPHLPAEWCVPGSGLYVNPIGCVEKSTSTATSPVIRLIVDASSGGVQSLNARISKSTVDAADESGPSYLSNRVIAATLLAAGPNALYSLTDIKSAFHNIALDPSNYRFSVIHFEGVWYCQTRLGFGFRSSPDIFEVVMEAFDRIQRTDRHLNILRIVDDVLNIDAPDVAARNTTILRADMSKYGLPMATAKNVDQLPEVRFNGLLWNAPTLSVTIPAPKIDDMRSCISAALLQFPPTLPTIESITGKLQAVTCVVPDGKAHLQHLYRNLAITKLKAPVRGRAVPFVATRYTRAELSWWHTRLSSVTPRRLVSLAAELLPTPDAVNVWTDASGTALGAFVPSTGAWTFLSVPPNFAVNPTEHSDTIVAVGSTLIEVAAIVLALTTFGEGWHDRHVHIHCDNSGAVGVFTRHHSSSANIGAMLTFAVDFCTARNITVHATWIEGVSNVIADAISRANWAAFRLAAPEANTHPTPCGASPFLAML